MTVFKKLKNLFFLSSLICMMTFHGSVSGQAVKKIAAPNASKTEFPATDAGAQKFLMRFLREGADHAMLSNELKPKAKDYSAFFRGISGSIARQVYESAWGSGQIVIRPKPGQTALLLYKANTNDFSKSEHESHYRFPGGYKYIASKLQPNRTVYRFKFVRPGETYGMAYDGLTYVNGRWVIFPKPWKALR